MKKNYEIPNIAISRFMIENIITTSGGEDNVRRMTEKMSGDGYTVTSVDLSDFKFTK